MPVPVPVSGTDTVDATGGTCWVIWRGDSCGSCCILSIYGKPGGHPIADFSQQCARNVTGTPDTDHSGDDLSIRAADIRVPDEESEPPTGRAAHRAGAAAARDHLGRDHDRPGDANTDGGADHDGRQGAGQNNASENVPG